MNLADMYPAVLTIVIIAIVLGIGLTVLGQLTTTGATTAAANTSINAAITALGGFSTWMTIIVLVIAASIILGLVISSFMGRKV